MRALNPTSPTGMTDCEIVLRALLSEGPRNSRDVLAELADRSFTAKQVRRARERQGVVIDRQGFGAVTQTTWRLPLGPSASTHALDGDHVRAGARDPGKTLRRTKPAEVATAQPMPAATPAELARMAGRIEAFQHRGVAAQEAVDIAGRLLSADRENRHALGSCVQCWSWRQGECPLTPKPIAEIHVCWLRRLETP